MVDLNRWFDPVTWPRISGYLDQLFDLDAEARNAWLCQLSISEPDIARILRDLLAESDALDAKGFLLEPFGAYTLESRWPHASATVHESLRKTLRGDLDVALAFAASIFALSLARIAAAEPYGTLGGDAKAAELLDAPDTTRK